MNFANSIILFGLLAIAIPIIIHLLNRKRHRTVQWAAMEFLRRATRESKGKKKLKHLIILTARALAVAGIIFAFSDPFSSSIGAGNATPNTVIFILDRSPSMELVTNEGTAGGGASKREISIATVQKTMADMPDTKLILLDSASEKRTDVTSPESLSKLSQTAMSDKGARITKLINSAINLAIDPEEKLGTTEIWVASDLQMSDWKIDSSDWATVDALIKENQQVRLRFIALTATSDSNTLVRVNKVRRDGNEIVIDTELSRTGGIQPETVAITYSVNNGSLTDEIQLTSSERIIRKRIPLKNNAEKGYGYVSIGPDTNLRDNVAYFVFGNKTELKTVIVSEGGESSDALYRSAALPDFEHLKAEVISPEKVNTIDWNATSLVIWQAPLPNGVMAEDLEDFIASGGTALFFPPENEDTGTFSELSWGEKKRAARDKSFNIAEWNHLDGPFRDGLSGEELPLDRIETITRRSIVGDVIPLASYEDGEPFAARKFIGRGRAIFLSTLPDLSWSYLEYSAINLITIHRLLEVAAETVGGNGMTHVGDEILKLRPNEDRRKIDNFATSSINNALYEAGVWGLGERVIAANRPVSEDAFEVAEVSALETALPQANYSLLENRGESESTSVLTKWWRFFLYATLAFLMLEALLTLPKKVQSNKKSRIT